MYNITTVMITTNRFDLALNRLSVVPEYRSLVKKGIPGKNKLNNKSSINILLNINHINRLHLKKIILVINETTLVTKKIFEFKLVILEKRFTYFY